MKRYIVGIMFIISTLFCLVSCSSSKDEPNVKIGIIDTSISNKTIKKYNIDNMSDFVNEKIKDSYTHGAVMLNIITNNTDNYDIYYATALDCTLTGDINTIVLAIDWCIKNNVDIICMSFATLKNDNNLQNKIEEAKEEGIVIVAACINYSDFMCYPAMYDGVISVSEGANPNASIIIKDMYFSIEIDGQIVEWEGCSALTAYVCGNIANELSKGNENIFQILKDIEEN